MIKIIFILGKIPSLCLTRCDETIAAARANVRAAKALKMMMINKMLSPENY